jgi:hypothetical protein
MVVDYEIISAFGTSMDKKSKPSLITFSARASRQLAPPASLRLTAARQNQRATTDLRTQIRRAASGRHCHGNGSASPFTEQTADDDCHREVEDLLAERGPDISYETMRRWISKFGHRNKKFIDYKLA